ncbi:MAG: adenylate/guanylate cyclase domain-containing protein [Myxococcota bacterium]
MKIHFRSFRARVLTFVSGLLILVQGAVLLAVNTANVSEARRHIDEALKLTASAFNRSLQVREQILREKARLLSADFAFKEAAATGDHATLLSALENHRHRVGADVMMLLELSSQVLADTLHTDAQGTPSPVLPLISEAMDSEFGEASTIQFLDGMPYQLVAVPLFTPEPTAWIVIGFAIHDAFARELQQETNTHVSLVRRESGQWNTFCSTLSIPAQRFLEASLTGPHHETREIVTLELDGDAYVSWLTPMSDVGIELVVVLQRSLHDALQPFLRLRTVLLLVFAIGIALSLVGGILLASRVTRPVAVLVSGARRIEAGNYTDLVDVEQHDELGSLAASFNHMMKGLAERDQVRDMLGRVVSPQIAEELLSKKIELGGEERTVSVFFTDIRDFTTVSEHEEPQRLVKILNTFLTGVSTAIEKHGGVVEEYMGDGVKALFGAPVQHEDDAVRSVRASLELQRSMTAINAEIQELGGAPLTIGVGVNTGVVVVGKMGSISRLKYTVVGDGVNLASRLEGLTKRYGVGIVVSETTREKCPEIRFREIDRVQVKGRRAPVVLFEPVGHDEEVTAEQCRRIDLHHTALGHYRAGDWAAAAVGFGELASLEPETQLFALYLERIERLRREPRNPDWDGTFRFDEK